jgi:hypothetical protein
MESRGRLSYIFMLRCVREKMMAGMRQKKNGQIKEYLPVPFPERITQAKS